MDVYHVTYTLYIYVSTLLTDHVGQIVTVNISITHMLTGEKNSTST